MATYLAHDALRLPAASLLANSGLCVNIEIKIRLLLGVNVDTAFHLTPTQCCLFCVVASQERPGFLQLYHQDYLQKQPLPGSLHCPHICYRTIVIHSYFQTIDYRKSLLSCLNNQYISMNHLSNTYHIAEL